MTAAGCLGSATKTVTATQTITSTETVTTTGSVKSAKPCLGTDLAATFAVIPNSAGAGQIAYALTVKRVELDQIKQGVEFSTVLGKDLTVLCPLHAEAVLDVLPGALPARLSYTVGLAATE